MDSIRLAQQLNNLMVDLIKQKGNIQTPTVEDAFRSVLRHTLLPNTVSLSEAYTDTAVVLQRSRNARVVAEGHPIVSSTMPSLVAAMLEAAELTKGLRVLHVGTGPGYLDALAARLVAPDGTVVTVEIDRPTSVATAKRLHNLGFSNIHCIAADGVFGFAPGAPYNRIMATAACASVPRPWVDQLLDEGLLVLPFALSAASTLYPIIVFRKRGNDLLGTVCSRLSMVSFLPLYGNNVPILVKHVQDIAELQRRIASQLSVTVGNLERLRVAQLTAILHVADALNRKPHEISRSFAEDVLTKTVAFLKRHEPRTVEDFVFWLTPIREDKRAHLWSFDQGDRLLYVDCQS